jgi:hypothetical protein
MPVTIMLGRIPQVGMVQVKAGQRRVRISPVMNVRGAGHEAERHVECAATQRENPTHSEDSI